MLLQREELKCELVRSCKVLQSFIGMAGVACREF